MSIWSSIWKGVKKVGSTVGSWFGGKKSSSSSFDWSGLGTAAAGLGSSALNYASTSTGLKQQYQYNKALQDQSAKYTQAMQNSAQQWASGMAATAHQLEVNDLRSAGLNPILSATGGSGASAPGATGGSVGAGSVGSPDYDLGAGLSTALAYRQQKNQNEMADAQVWNQRKQASLFGEQARNESENYKNIKQNRINSTRLVNKQIDDLESQIQTRNASTAATIERLRTQNDVDRMNAYTNQKVGSANAYFNLNRSLGYSESYTPNRGVSWSFGLGPVKGSGGKSSSSYSRTW
nr:minor tail protein [Microvirus sp.]CAI9751563.1 minor tail protein [Microvirus sp.]